MTARLELIDTEECECEQGVRALAIRPDGTRWISACAACGGFDSDEAAADAYTANHGGCWSWEYGKYDPDSPWQHPLWIPEVVR